MTTEPSTIVTPPALRGAAAKIATAQASIAARGGTHIGDLVSWNARGVDVHRDLGRAVFSAVAMEKFWPGLEPGTACYRAVQAVRPPKPGKGTGGDRYDVRSLARPNPDTPVAYGIYRVEGRRGESGDKFTCGARVRVDTVQRVIVGLAPENEPAIDEALAIANRIADHANHLLQFAETRDVSNAMAAVVRELAGVPFRDNGGMYLLPPAQCAVWRALMPGLRELGVEPIAIDMYDSPNAVAAAGSAAKGALEKDIGALMQELRQAQDAGMRPAPIRRRIADCEALSARVELYRGVLLGTADQLLEEAARVKDGLSRVLGGIAGGDEAEADGGDLFDIPVKEDD